MLTPESILELLQSFYRSCKASPIPDSPLPPEEFGKLCFTDLGEGKVCENILSKCRELLDLPVSLQIPDCAMAEHAEQLCEEWTSGERNISFRTSGTEGEPKQCMHSYRDLMEEGSFLAELCEGVSHVVSAVPAHHCYGFMFSLWLPLLMDIPVRRTIPFASAFLSALSDDAMGVGFPLLYDKAFPKNGSARLVSASSPLNPDSFNKMKMAGYRLLEIFGSSETGVMGYRMEANAPFKLAPYYRKSGNGLIRRNSGNSAKIMDMLEWRDESHFFPLGRCDQQIQIGGRNVSLTSVKNFICGCPGVLDCSVRAMRSGEGNRLKAFLVVASGFRKDELKRRLRKLPPEERPQSMTFGSELPTNAMGKLSDW